MRAAYITARRLLELDSGLSVRDRAILGTVARVRVASGAQLVRLHLGDIRPRQGREVLASLVARGLLARLPRQVGGVRAGSAGFVYSLGIAGQRLTRPQGSRPQRPWQVSSRFLDHSLAVTELLVRLTEADRAGELWLVDFQTEPASWRTFTALGGGRAVLKPDAEVTIRLGRYEDRWFVEVDRATESGPTLLRKCQQYVSYWQSGVEQAAREVFPQVLWLVPDAARQTQLVEVLGQLPAEAWRLFTVAVYADGVARLTQGAGV